jgi:hypothetical protein
MNIAKTISELTSAQIDVLMGLMERFGWNVTEAMIFGWTEISSAK